MKQPEFDNKNKKSNSPFEGDNMKSFHEKNQRIENDKKYITLRNND